MKYRPDIDGLRAVAVLPVLLYHFGQETVSGGFAGVDVFFVISGYLIAGTILADLDRGAFSILTFYWRRAKRILPALIFTLVASMIAASWLLLPSALLDFSWSVIATSTFWSNVYFWKTTDYFAPSAILRPLLHTWSLAVEEQYYIFAPIAMWAVYRYLNRAWLWVLVPLIALSLLGSILGSRMAASASFYLLPTRAWELMAGAALMLCRPPLLRRRWQVEALGLAGLGLLAFTYFGFDATDPWPGANALVPVLASCLLIHAGSHARSLGAPVATRLLQAPPLVWIGLISYSLYLVHWPLLSFVAQARMVPVQAPWLMTGISIVIAAVMWRYVEQPFRARVPRNGPRPIFLQSGAAIVASIAAAMAIIAAAGMPQRFPTFEERRIATAHWRNGVCFLSEDTADRFDAGACVHDFGFPETRVMLWGDSFAAHYVSGLGPNAAAIGSNVLQYTFQGCPPVLAYASVARPACTGFNRRALDLIESRGIDTVLIAARWPDYQDRTLAALEETIREVQARGAEALIIGQSPEFLADVQQIAFAAERRGLATDAWPAAQKIHANPILARIAAETGSRFVDPMALLCTDGACPYRDAVDYHYFDYGHMSTQGATTALRAYLAAIDAPEEIAGRQ